MGFSTPPIEQGQPAHAESDNGRPCEAGGPAFVLLFDAPTDPTLERAHAVRLALLAQNCGRVLGFTPRVVWAPLPPLNYRGGSEELTAGRGGGLSQRLDELARDGCGPAFVLPVSFDFGVHSKQWLTQVVREQQRRCPELLVHYDAENLTHPLLLQCFVDSACCALGELSVASPNDLGLLLVANGAADAETRADSYKLMRLVWEQLAVSRGDVAFVRHTRHPLPEQLSLCSRTGLSWLLLAQYLWPCEQLEYARVITRDCAQQFSLNARLTEPIGEHPGVQAWLEQRCLELYKSWRGRREARTTSTKYIEAPPGRIHGPTGQVMIEGSSASDESLRFAGGLIAEVRGADELAQLLAGFGVGTGRVVVKPTWHGYATGTYTDPLALDTLLAAVGPGAVVVEGHTSSKNTHTVDWDWETQAREHRTWIEEQDHLYLEKTGLRHTLSSRGASYLNVTEAYWDERCADPREVTELLAERGVALRFKELAAYVPAVLFENRGLPLISFARFKGPTRLSTSNLFGLLPEPLRAAWHGPNITYFAQVCCDLAKLYSSLFELYGLVESLNVAVRWERSGLYRSRWGNYDLLPRPGVVCISRGVAVADVLAARLQGQDVRRSAFFDVVQAELGFDVALASAELPAELVRRFV